MYGFHSFYHVHLRISDWLELHSETEQLLFTAQPDGLIKLSFHNLDSKYCKPGFCHIWQKLTLRTQKKYSFKLLHKNALNYNFTLFYKLEGVRGGGRRRRRMREDDKED